MTNRLFQTLFAASIGFVIAFAATTASAIAGSAIESGGGAALVGGTAGQIPYADTASSITTEASGFAWDSTNNRLGIGDDTPDAKLECEAGTMTDGIPAMRVGATFPNGLALQMSAVDVSVTGPASGVDNSDLYGAARINLASGGSTAARRIYGLEVTTAATSNATSDMTNASPVGQYGVYARATSFSPVGGLFVASATGANAAGVVGYATGTYANGVVGLGNPGGSGGAGVVGMLTTSGTIPTTAPAGVVASNGTTTSDIFLGLDNLTRAFTIADGGNVCIGNDSTPNAKLEITSDTAANADLYLSALSTGDAVISFGTHDSTRKWSMGVDNSTANDNFSISIGGTLGTQEIIQIDGLSAVTRFNAGVIFSMPDAQTITAGATINAAACGTMQKITSAGDVTTSTTNTFAAPSVDNTGCCFDMVNTGSANITLDNNAKFASAGGADVVLGASDSLRVCSDGVKWYMIGAKGDN